MSWAWKTSSGQVHSGLSAVVVLLALTPGVALAITSARPPSSLEPQAASADVAFTYKHRRVRSCLVGSHGQETICTPRFEAHDASTVLTLLPLPDATLEARKDARTPVGVTVSTHDPSKRVSVGLGPWEVSWPGYEERPRFTANGGDAVAVSLEGTSGRCEVKRGGGCKLIEGVVQRRANVAIH